MRQRLVPGTDGMGPEGEDWDRILAERLGNPELDSKSAGAGGSEGEEKGERKPEEDASAGGDAAEAAPTPVPIPASPEAGTKPRPVPVPVRRSTKPGPPPVPFPANNITEDTAEDSDDTRLMEETARTPLVPATSDDTQLFTEWKKPRAVGIPGLPDETVGEQIEIAGETAEAAPPLPPPPPLTSVPTPPSRSLPPTQKPAVPRVPAVPGVRRAPGRGGVGAGVPRMPSLGRGRGRGGVGGTPPRGTGAVQPAWTGPGAPVPPVRPQVPQVPRIDTGAHTPLAGIPRAVPVGTRRPVPPVPGLPTGIRGAEAATAAQTGAKDSGLDGLGAGGVRFVERESLFRMTPTEEEEIRRYVKRERSRPLVRTVLAGVAGIVIAGLIGFGYSHFAGPQARTAGSSGEGTPGVSVRLPQQGPLALPREVKEVTSSGTAGAETVPAEATEPGSTSASAGGAQETRPKLPVIPSDSATGPVPVESFVH